MERVAEKERSSYKKKNICIHSNWLCVVDVVFILLFLPLNTYMEYGNLTLFLGFRDFWAINVSINCIL